MLIEDTINSETENIQVRIEALKACYQEVMKDSVLRNLDSLNYWARHHLLELNRSTAHTRLENLYPLFIEFDNRLVSICIEGYGNIRA